MNRVSSPKALVMVKLKLQKKEQLEDQVLQQFRQIRSENNNNEKMNAVNRTPYCLNSIDLKKCFVGNLLCIKESSFGPDIYCLKFCVPLSLISKAFLLADCEFLGHVGLGKIFANITIFFWPGLYKRIYNLIVDRLVRQRKNHK